MKIYAQMSKNKPTRKGLPPAVLAKIKAQKELEERLKREADEAEQRRIEEEKERKRKNDYALIN